MIPTQLAKFVMATATLGALLVSQGCTDHSVSAAAHASNSDPQSQAQAATKDPAAEPHECDRLAAHPSDLNRRATGVADDQIIPALAVAACEAAVASFPNEPRFQYQLGRAYFAKRALDSASEHLEHAAESGYAPAQHELARRAITLYRQSKQLQYLDEAREFLAQAAESFEPAATLLSSITFDPSLFQNPVIIHAWYTGDTAKLQDSRLPVAVFAKGFQAGLGMEFSPYDQSCTAMMDPFITRNLDEAIAGDAPNPLEGLAYFGGKKLLSFALKFLDPAWRGDETKYLAYVEELGKREAHALAVNYGCFSPITRDTYAGMLAFAKQARPLKEYAQAMINGHPKTLFLQKLPEQVNEERGSEKEGAETSIETNPDKENP
jgi:hypothetical protein